MTVKTNEVIIKGKNAVLTIESNIYGLCEFLIDVRDIKRVKEHSWYVTKNSGCNLYAVSSYSKKNGYKGYLHRFIMNCPKDKVVDHKNGNTLDNRRCNLRICTHTDNMKNTKLRTDNTSGHRYIHFCKERNVWYVQIKRKRIGTFKILEEAVSSRNEYLLENCKEELFLAFDRQ